MGSSADHSRLVHEIVLALSRLGVCTVWVNNTGTALSVDLQRVITYGLPGSPDIIGFISPSGKFIGIEVKTGSAKQSKIQKNFETVLTHRGGYYSVVRSVEEALLFVKVLTN